MGRIEITVPGIHCLFRAEPLLAECPQQARDRSITEMPMVLVGIYAKTLKNIIAAWIGE